MAPLRPVKKSLLAALRNDDAERFRVILNEEGWPTNSEWSDYELLIKAVRNGCKRVAWVLLEKGARVMKKLRINSPLHEAASRLGWTNFVKVLLDRGANVADLNGKGDTALHIAFLHHTSMEMIDLLLRAQLRNDAKDVVNKDGLSFLHIACTRPHLKYVRAFVEQGLVDVDVQVPVVSNSAYAGYTPLHFAVEFGQYDVVEYLLSNYDVDMYEQDANGSTPLHKATERGDVRMIDLILRYDENREDCYNSFGLSHFMAVCAGSDESLIEDYLRVAAYRSWTEPDTLITSQVEHQRNYPNAGYTPLHFAAVYGRVNTVKLLLQLGARCFSTSLDNVTPFELACKYGHADVCRLLEGCCMLDMISKEMPAKRRRVESMNVKYCVDSSDDLKKLSGSIDSDASTLTANSPCVLPFESLADSLDFSDPLKICVNPRQIFDSSDENSLQDSIVFYNRDDSGIGKDESSSENENDRLICNQGVWNFKISTVAEYPSIVIPKDIESDFYEPLDDSILDYSLDFVDTIQANQPTADISSSVISQNLDSTSDEPLDYSLSKITKNFQVCSPKEIDSNSNYLSNSSPVNEVFCPTEQAFDDLFEKFLSEPKVADNEDEVLDLSYDRSIVYSIPSPRREIKSSEKKLESTDISANDDLETTLEVTSLSSDSEMEEETAYSYISDGSSTACLSSGYDTDSSMECEDYCSARKSNLSTWSNPENFIEVKFVEVEGLRDRQLLLATIPEESVESVENDQSSEKCLDTSALDNKQLSATDSQVKSQSCDLSSPINSLNPFEFSFSNEQYRRIFECTSSFVLDFDRY